VTEPGEARFRIGEVAAQAGVSPRTLRYYQELGLLDPAGLSPGGSRRYSARDVARLRRILELRDVMGFDLERINIILHAEDRLAELRDEVRAGVSTERYRAAVEEAITINNGMRAQVEEKAARYRHIAHDLDVEGPTDARPGRAVEAAG
jgi:DNA-binding transcriptional MerR regulator